MVAGPYATYDLPATSILWAAAVVNFQYLTNRLVDSARACEIKVSTEKSKIMANSRDNISAY